MANKLFLVCATLAFCVLLTNASIYRTVVEFDEEDDTTNPIGPFGPPQKCKREFQQEQHLRACQEWIRKQLAGSPFSENQWGPQQGPSLRQQCCHELYQEDQECVCPTLKQAAKSVKVQGQHGPLQSTRIYQIAKNLPNVCNMKQIGKCPFIAIPFFPPY